MNSKLLACLAVVAAVGVIGVAASAGQATSSTTVASAPGDWLTFNLNGLRSGGWPTDAGITAGNLHTLKRMTLHIDGTVDSSAVALQSLTIGGRTYAVFFVTTDYGRTLAINAANGHILWQYAPASVQKLQGSAQITTSSPLIDPGLQYIYVTSPDGYVHKLSITTGHPVWSTRVTWDPTHEKLAGALNLDDNSLVVVTDGYNGDTPPYQGHVVTINPSSGHITHVWNSLCSNIKGLIHPPSKCSSSDSAIWGRPGSVVLANGDILVATSNGPFNGHTDWGDSVLELSPTLKLLHNWTPRDQEHLNTADLDLGSTSPAVLPVTSGPPLAVQGGKDGILRLLDLNRLDGTGGKAGPRTGGELQDINAPGPTDVYSQPAVWSSGGRIYVFVGDGSGTAEYTLGGRHLHLGWSNNTPGTSPVIADGLLFVYDEQDGFLDVYNPHTGHLDIKLPAAQGHWNSPIVIDGRIILPEGDDNDHSVTGTIDIYHLPGA
jgi:outer membrane protein assembly factor BamB